jgi:hypothetical protein
MCGRSLQAVRKTFSARHNQDTSLVDEAELECHQNLQRLFNTTRAAKVCVPFVLLPVTTSLADGLKVD